MKTVKTSVALLGSILLLLQPAGAQEEAKLRSDLERELPAIEAALREAPGEPDRRRAYAAALFELGNMREAHEVIAPLATPWSFNAHDLELGARLSLMLSDYRRAEQRYRRLSEVAEEGSDMHAKAISGLALVLYQMNRYAEARGLELPPDGEGDTLLEYMQKFEGEPYQVEWANAERVAHLKMTNDFRRPGALPLMKLEVNGHEVEFILDTGGDRLYVDRDVAERIGIRRIHERQARYAYTGGETVDEPLGVADTVKLGEVTLRNVPVICATWKALGALGDGVVTTQILKQFLSTVDYGKGEITLRERSPRGREQLLESFGDQELHRLPFFMAKTHLMFTKGSLNGRQGLNMFMDSGLAASMALVIHDETVEDLGLEKTPLEGTQYYSASFESHGIGTLTRGAAQGLGNVIVERDPYLGWGFLFDALISHQYLYHLGSWTIDFDTMTYYFPTEVEPAVPVETETPESEVEEGPAPTDAELEGYAGEYRCDAIASEIGVTFADGKLRFTATGNLRGAFALAWTGKDTFKAEGVPQEMVLEFELEEGRATRARVSIGGQGPFTFERQ